MLPRTHVAALLRTTVQISEDELATLIQPTDGKGDGKNMPVSQLRQILGRFGEFGEPIVGDPLKSLPTSWLKETVEVVREQVFFSCFSSFFELGFSGKSGFRCTHQVLKLGFM